MTQASRSREWLWAAALLIVTILAYVPAWHGSFIWDDGVMVADNPLLRSGRGLHDIWFTTRAVDPLPVTMTALWLQWHCWDGNTFGYHIVGVLAHGLGAVLLWRVLLHFMPRPGLAWLAAAIFALHPVAVASVAWISEQKNTLSIIFYLLAVLFYLRFAGSRRWAEYALALIFFMLALLSKGSTVMLPAILLLALWWRQARLKPGDLGRLLPFFVLAALASLFTIWIQNHKALAGAAAQDLALPARFAAAGDAVWFYWWKDLWPADICVIYPLWPIQTNSVGAWLPLFGLAALFCIGWRYRTGWGRHALLGLGGFVISLFPVLGFFDMYFLVYSRVADHWQYIALPAFAGLVTGVGGWGLERASAKFHLPTMVGPILAAALLACLFFSTWKRAAIYASEMALWTDTVAKNPRAWMAWNNLGNACSAAGRSEPAIDAYTRAITVNTNFPDAESNLGNELVKRGQFTEALGHLQKAVAEEPALARFHFNYGVGLAALGRLDAAIAEYARALELNPAAADARNNLAGVLYQQKKYEASLQQAQTAIQMKPELPEPYLNAAKALAALDRNREAARNFETFLRLRPNNAGARFEYGMMLALHGDLAAALPQFQEVVRLQPGESAGHGSLGNTLAGLKRFAEAAVEFRAALALEPGDAQNHNNLANVLLEEGKLDEALEQYSIAVKLNPNDSGTRVNYGLALLRAGRRGEASAQFHAAARLKPGDPAIQSFLRQ